MEVKTDPVDIKYEIGDDIGRGKFATVKRCRDRNTGCEYAAKFIRKSRGTGRRGAKMENIEKEIQILSETNHRNIINLYEVYDTKREVILILELVDGGELFEYLSEKDKLCEEEASSFVKQILEGVEHLHAQDIAHLDLKPENILLQDKNSTAVKLIDFGLSRKILPKEDHRAIMGTAEFCAPEVISFEPLSVQTDMWSIGVITYVLLSGLSPFLGDNQQETYHNITSINFEFDEEYFNGTSDLAKDFIQKLLVKDTRKRATIQDCLNHPWIKPVEKRDQVLRRSSVINTEHLKKFIARQRWKRSMKVVSLCNRLSRSMQLRRIMSSDTIGSTSEEDTDTEKQENDEDSSELTGLCKENVCSMKDLAQDEDKDKENNDIDSINKEETECKEKNFDIANIGREYCETEGVIQVNGNVKVEKEFNKLEDTTKENADIYNISKDLAEIMDTDKGIAGIDRTNMDSTDTFNTSTEKVHKTNFNKKFAEITNMYKDNENSVTGFGLDTSFDGYSQFLIKQTSCSQIKGQSDLASVSLTAKTVEVEIPDTQNPEEFEPQIFESTMLPKCIKTERLTTDSKNDIGKFDDHIGLLVSGSFESELDPLGIAEFVQLHNASGKGVSEKEAPVKNRDVQYSENVPERPYNFSCTSVQQKRLSFTKVGDTDVYLMAQFIVAQVLEAAVGNVLRGLNDRIISNGRFVLQPDTHRESGSNKEVIGENDAKHSWHYDPLRLVCFEVDDAMQEEQTDEENDEELEKEIDFNIPKEQKISFSVKVKTVEEMENGDSERKIFKPHATSKFDFSGQKHLEQRSYRRSKKTRPELKLKKKTNRFWEMEDLVDTGRYEIFEMQVLNNSE